MSALQSVGSLALLFLVLLWCSLLGANADQRPQAPALQVVSVAAAADLRFALEEIITNFQAAQPQVQVKATYGSSGNLYAQLSQRAPFDVFFSADLDYPAKLMAAGLGLSKSQFTYAIGHLALWARADSPIDPVKLGPRVLLDPAVKRIALANPEHAPYGRAAIAALRKLGLYEAVKDKLVFGENIAQAAQFVESGSADLGLVALSLATAPPMKTKGRYWEIPPENYPPLAQGGLILSWAKNPEAARAFRDFVVGSTGGNILRRFGFALP